jgi:transposase
MEARMLRMDEFNKIRKEFFTNQKSVYGIAKEYNRSWETINNIIKIPEHLIEARGKRTKKNHVVTPEVNRIIHELLEFEVLNKVPKKQRFSAKFIFKKVKEECNYKGSAKRIRTIVAIARKEFKTTNPKTFLELDFELGHYLQVDHGEVELKINGHQIIGYLFVGSVPGAVLRYCQFYPTKAAESWGAFHENCFLYFGGVFPNCTYDNDSVLRKNKGDESEETKFAIELRTHYDFNSIYCNRASGNEKGAVENGVGFCRRNFLAGIQSFDSFEQLNISLKNQCDDLLMSEKHYISGKPLSEYLETVKKNLRPFNQGRRWGRYEDFTVNKFQQFTYQDHAYSVPERFVGSSINAYITSDRVTVHDGDTVITDHSRKFLTGEDSILLDHYLEQLSRKPAAIPFSKAIKNEDFNSSLLTFWDRLKNKHGEKEGNIQFVMTLMLKRRSSEEDFQFAIDMALSCAAISHDGAKSILHQIQIEQVRSMEDYPTLLADEHFNMNQYYELQEVLLD